jgi:hypothetical protein
VLLKKISASAKNNILVQGSKILPTISPFYAVNPFISRRCVGDILSEERNGRMRHVKV